MQKVLDLVFMILAKFGIFDDLLVVNLSHEHKSETAGARLLRRQTHS